METLLCQGYLWGGQNRGRAAKPGQFEVRVLTPPPKSLGIHRFPPNTHNGDQIEVDGKDYVVASISLKYHRVGGKYVRMHNRLNVQSTGLYFTTQQLNKLLED